MTSAFSFQRRWAWLLGAHAWAAVLIALWLWPPTRVAWDALDDAVFFTLNGSLSWGRPWQVFWALANWRPFDALAAAVVAALCLYWAFANGGDAKRRLVQLALFAGVFILVVQATHGVTGALGYERHSPTQTYSGTFRLSKRVEWIPSKDKSTRCFPGDHAAVLISMAGFLWLHGGRRMGWTATASLAPFILPRMVSGAHWATDALVGAHAEAAVALGWWFGTPLHDRVSTWLARRFDRPLTWIERNLRGMWRRVATGGGEVR